MEHNDAAGASLAASTERMAAAAEQLHALLEKMGLQMDALNRKVDRIVAAIDEVSAVAAPAGAEVPASSTTADAALAAVDTGEAEAAPEAKRARELEKENAELKAAAQRVRRKTLSGATLALLAKSGADDGQAIEGGALEQALRSLSVEQRIAVKAEMARAGLL